MWVGRDGGRQISRKSKGCGLPVTKRSTEVTLSFETESQTLSAHMHVIMHKNFTFAILHPVIDV